MPGELSEHNCLEFCYGVKVELIKCWTTSQFEFPFNSPLGNIFKHKVNQHKQFLFVIQIGENSLHYKQSLFDGLFLTGLIGRFITDT